MRRSISLASLLLSLASSAFAGNLLSLVPEDAATVGMIRLSQVRTSPLATKLFNDTDHITCDGDAARFMQEAGLDPAKDVDTILVAVAPESGDAKDGDVLVMFEGRFEIDRLSAAVAARGGLAQSASGAVYYRLPEKEGTAAVAFVSPSLTLAGTEPAVQRALANLKSGGTDFIEASGLGREYRRIDKSAAAWLLVDVQRAQRFAEAPSLPSKNSDNVMNTFGSAVKYVSTIAAWATESGDQLRFGGTAIVHDEETSRLIEDTLRGLTAMWRMAAQEKHPEWVSVIRKFEIERTKDGVSMKGTVPAQLIKETQKKIVAER